MNKLNVLLLLMALASAAMVVTVRHENRLEFVALRHQEQQRDALQAEWGRLMLEKATWSGQHNVAETANKQLAMSAPMPDKIVTLQLDQSVSLQQSTHSEAGNE